MASQTCLSHPEWCHSHLVRFYILATTRFNSCTPALSPWFFNVILLFSLAISVPILFCSMSIIIMHLSLLSISCLSDHRYLSSYPHSPLPFLNPYCSTPNPCPTLSRIHTAVQRLPCHLARCSSHVLLPVLFVFRHLSHTLSTSGVMQRTNTTFVFLFPICHKKNEKRLQTNYRRFPNECKK